MKIRTIIVSAVTAAVFAACAPKSEVGLINVTRIATNWPKFKGYAVQLQNAERQIATTKASDAVKAREAQELEIRYGKITAALTNEIKSAAAAVAQQKNLKLVVTQEGVGYGGVDITPDVEKVLHIVETSPSPSPSP